MVMSLLLIGAAFFGTWLVLGLIIWGVNERLFFHRTGFSYAEAEVILEDMRSRYENEYGCCPNIETLKDRLKNFSASREWFDETELNIAKHYKAYKISAEIAILPLLVLFSPILIPVGLVCGLKVFWESIGSKIVNSLLGIFSKVFLFMASIFMIGTKSKNIEVEVDCQKGPYR